MPTKAPSLAPKLLLRNLHRPHPPSPLHRRHLQPPQSRTFSHTHRHHSPITNTLNHLNHRLTHHLSGTRLEILKFAFYISFPIGFMYYFGVNLTNDETSPFREAARDFWPDREMTHKVPFEREEIREEMERLRARRLEVRERRLEREALEEEGRRRLEGGEGGGAATG
ncbi:MAG: hypothetical protein M1831_004620 [Alyxoria varia]|nr:MAG: hypothetical protein M1831_004620 [Alyxoria varia]